MSCYFIEIPEEYRNKWESFVSSTLAEINKKNTVKLVCISKIEFYLFVSTHFHKVNLFVITIVQILILIKVLFFKWIIIWIVFQVQGHPLQSSSEDDDADFSDLSFTQDSVMQQVSTSHEIIVKRNNLHLFWFELFFYFLLLPRDLFCSIILKGLPFHNI